MGDVYEEIRKERERLDRELGWTKLHPDLAKGESQSSLNDYIAHLCGWAGRAADNTNEDAQQYLIRAAALAAAAVEMLEGYDLEQHETEVGEDPSTSKLCRRLVQGLREGEEVFTILIRIAQDFTWKEATQLSALGIETFGAFQGTVVRATVDAHQLLGLAKMDAVASVEAAQTLRPV